MPGSQVAVDSLHALHSALEGQVRFDTRTGSRRPGTRRRRIGEGASDSVAEPLTVAAHDDETVHAVGDELRRAAGVGGDDRRLEGHGFENGVWRALVVRGLDQQVKGVVEPLDVVAVPDELATVAQTDTVDLSLQFGPQAAVAGMMQEGEASIASSGATRRR